MWSGLPILTEALSEVKKYYLFQRMKVLKGGG